MFGRSLQETMQVETRLGGGYVPILLHRCARFIHEEGVCVCVCDRGEEEEIFVYQICCSDKYLAYKIFMDRCPLTNARPT